MVSHVLIPSCWTVHSSGSFRAARLPRQATRGVRAVSLWSKKIQSLPLTVFRLFCCPVTVRRLCPIIPQDNIVVGNKHNYPEFYLGNARACPGLEPPMMHSIFYSTCTAFHAVHVQMRSLKFEAQYLQICRYNYAVATLVTEVLSKAQSAGVSMSFKSFH